MTRINSSINVRYLTDEHLLAEHREIKRLPSVYKKRLDSGKGFKDDPMKFTLGKGHVLYFVSQGAYTAGRYLSIYEECLNRGFNVENYFNNWNVYNSDDTDFIQNDHIPSIEEHEMVVERITDRLLNTKKECWHYYGKPIPKEDAVKLLKGELEND